MNSSKSKQKKQKFFPRKKNDLDEKKQQKWITKLIDWSGNHHHHHNHHYDYDLYTWAIFISSSVFVIDSLIIYGHIVYMKKLTGKQKMLVIAKEKKISIVSLIIGWKVEFFKWWLNWCFFFFCQIFWSSSFIYILVFICNWGKKLCLKI